MDIIENQNTSNMMMNSEQVILRQSRSIAVDRWVFGRRPGVSQSFTMEPYGDYTDIIWGLYNLYRDYMEPYGDDIGKFYKAWKGGF